jgi:hypothetical protein
MNQQIQKELWRKRVGVEPTIRIAKSRINGFEGHEDHRTSCASVANYSSAGGEIVCVSDDLPRLCRVESETDNIQRP